MSRPDFKYFVIFGSMRSGSNLLEQSLNQFSDITCHGELFNPAFIGGPKKEKYLGFSFARREENPVALLEAMIADSNDKISGFRIFDGHDTRILQKALQDPDCAKIILRRDILDSFISLKIAKKTNQWLLRDAPQKKDAKVHFDAAEFQKYRDAQNAYYQNIRKTLQESGQTAYWLDYPDQKNLRVLNGIAKFLGASGPLKSVKETLRRQNPGPLQDKVENFEEMQTFLNIAKEREVVTASDPQMRANIPRMVSCMNNPLLFAPIPGGPNEEILRWMQAIDEAPAPTSSYADAVNNKEILHTGHSQRTLFEWMQSNPDVIAITAAKHPIPRVYDAFMSKVFRTGPETYNVIRKQLFEGFGVELPDTDMMKGADRVSLEAIGYEVKHHRAAFHGFLKFLKSNLAGQTSIRIDGLWATQLSFLAGFNSAVPIAMIAKEGRLDPSFRYIETLLDIPEPKLGKPIQPDHMFSLNEIYTRQTENLARKAYSVDYTRFGFDDYQAALDA